MTAPRDIAQAIECIPPLSSAAARLMQMSADDGTNMKEVARMVELEPGLTANVLKVVNAPAFGLSTPVHSVSRAVSYLGLESVAGIALASCAPQIFNTPLEGYEARPGELWRHCLHVAIATREIVKFCRSPLPTEIAFTSGILHDIGKAVIAAWFKEKTTELLSAVDARKADGFDNAEQQALGFDHTDVGCALAEHWQLPEVIRQTARHHHRPQKCAKEYRPIVYAVHLGDIVAMLSGSATGADAFMYPLDKSYEDYFDLSEVQLETLIMNASLEFMRTQTDFLNSNG